MENTCEGRPVSFSAVQKKLSLSFKKSGALSASLLEEISSFSLQLAQKHAGSKCVFLSIDSLHFFHPILEKDFLLAKASINRVWDSYMEIGIKVTAEDFRLLQEKDILSAYFTYLAVDKEAKPALVPKVIPQTEEEKKRYQAADLRRKMRSFSNVSKREIFPHTSYFRN